MKVKFVFDGRAWRGADNAFVMWNPGIFITSVTGTHVILGCLTEPLGCQPRDKIVDDFLLKYIDFVGGEFVPKTFIDPDGTAYD